MSDHRYHLNGLAVESDLPLPCDGRGFSRALDSLDPAVDRLRVRLGSLQDFPCALRKVRRQLCYDVGDGVLIETGEFLLHVDKAGRTLTVDAPEEHRALAALWVLGAGMAASAFFRGQLPLRAAAVQAEGRMVAVVGPEGSGKSTLAWALLRQGALFASDGLLPLRFERAPSNASREAHEAHEAHEAQIVTAIPSPSLHPRLPRATMRRHRIPLKRHGPVRAGGDEFWMPIDPARRASEPTALAALFVLRPRVPKAKAPRAEAPSPEGRAHRRATGKAAGKAAGKAQGRSGARVEEALEGPKEAPEKMPEAAPVVRRLSREEAGLLVESSVAGWALVRRQVSEAELAARCLAVCGSVPAYEVEYTRSFSATASVARAIRSTVKTMEEILPGDASALTPE